MMHLFFLYSDFIMVICFNAMRQILQYNVGESVLNLVFLQQGTKLMVSQTQ